MIDRLDPDTLYRECRRMRYRIRRARTESDRAADREWPLILALMLSCFALPWIALGARALWLAVRS